MILQGPDTNILQLGDIFRGFIEKIHNWNRRVNQESFAVFENRSKLESGLSLLIKQETTEHLQSLKNEFEKYFPDLEEGSDVFPRNPFSVMIDIATIPEEVQVELLELRNDSADREIFVTKSLSQFWSSMLTFYQSYQRNHCALLFHLPPLIFVKADFLLSCTSNHRLATS